MYDVIIVGAGFAGSVVAHELAEKGNKILVLERRGNIAGNMYEEYDEHGIRIHKYGPHIFHTNSKDVYEYVNKFCEMYFYEHRVLGSIDGKLVPIPFNFKSIELIFNKEEATKIKDKLLKYFNGTNKVSILDLIHHDDRVIKQFGEYVYEKVFANYTAKQWETKVENIDTSVINRVPVIIGYDDRYFQDKYQFMPKNGYNEIFENLLRHDNITVKTNENALEYIKVIDNDIYYNNERFDGKLVYTGQIEELFKYKHGELPYRSLRFEFENYNMNYYQPVSVVNYPNDNDYTRITEFKYLTNQQNKTTTILKEYPQKYNKENTPYYSIINEKNLNVYDLYKKDAESIPNLYMCGRLAEYKYYNMDQVILRALEVVKEME